MNARRVILSVLLVLALSACTGTASRDESPAQPANGGPTPPVTGNPVRDGQEPVFTPVARKRPTPPAKPRPTTPAPAAVAPPAAPPVAQDAASNGTGGNGETAPTSADEPDAVAIAMTAPVDEPDGPDADAIAEPMDEPGQMAMLEPDDRDAPAGAGTFGTAAGVMEPPKPAPPPSFEERSLKCDVIELMGQAIGRGRIRGEPRKPAVDKAIDEVVRQTGAVRDKRFVFSGRVYGMLIYQLEQEHTVDGFGAYALSACLILRGGKGIVPADEASDKLLNQALSICESGSRSPGELNACISERMEEIVRQRRARFLE